MAETLNLQKLLGSGGGLSYVGGASPTGLTTLSGDPYTANFTTGGGSTLGGDSDTYNAPAAPTYDPQAQERSNFLTQLPGSISNITQSGSDAFGSAQRGLQGTAENLYNTVNQGQKSINTSRENIELNRLNGVKDILGFVRNGLKSGATRLSNMNSLESSAAGQVGRAYSSMGNDRSRNVGNQAFLQNRGVDTQQDNLNVQKEQGKRDIQRTRDDHVATIGSKVRQELAALDAEGQGLGITGKIAVDAEKQKVIDQGLAQLNEVDRWLQSQLGGVNPEGADAVRTNAVALQQGGQGNITPFDFGETGMQVQGPAIDQLPLFTRNKRITG